MSRSWKHADLWVQVQHLAKSSHGLITLDQLRTIGFSDPQIRGLVGQLRLTRAHRGVYRIADAPISWQSKLLLLTMRTEGVASHLSAAMLYRLARPTDLSCGYAEITAMRAPSRRIEREQVYQDSNLGLLTPTVVQQIPTTSIERCLLDIAAVHSTSAFDTALNAAVRKQLTTYSRVEAALMSDGRRRNRRRMEAALLRSRGRTCPALSEWSVWAVQLLVSAGLPAASLEHRLLDNQGHLIAQVDLYLAEVRIAIELDGGEFHLNRSSFHSDRARDAALAGIDVVVLRFTWEQYCAPGYFLRTVTSAITARTSSKRPSAS